MLSKELNRIARRVRSDGSPPKRNRTGTLAEDEQKIKDMLQELNDCDDPQWEFELGGNLDELLRPYDLLLAHRNGVYVITE